MLSLLSIVINRKFFLCLLISDQEQSVLFFLFLVCNFVLSQFCLLWAVRVLLSVPVQLCSVKDFRENFWLHFSSLLYQLTAIFWLLITGPLVSNKLILNIGMGIIYLRKKLIFFNTAVKQLISIINNYHNLVITRGANLLNYCLFS